MPAASGGCAEEGCQELKFSQVRRRAPTPPLWDLLRTPFVRNGALWLIIVLFVVLSMIEGPATPGPQQPLEIAPPEEGRPLVSFLTSWFPMLLLIGGWIFFMTRLGVPTRQFVVLNAALFGVVALLLFGLSILFAPTQ